MSDTQNPFVDKVKNRKSNTPTKENESKEPPKTPYDLSDNSPGNYLVAALNGEYGGDFARNETVVRQGLDVRVYIQMRLEKAILRGELKDGEADPYKELIEKNKDSYPSYVLITNTLIKSYDSDAEVYLCSFMWSEKYTIKNITDSYIGIFFGYDERVNINTGKIIQNDDQLTEAINGVLDHQNDLIVLLGEKYKNKQGNTTEE